MLDIISNLCTLIFEIFAVPMPFWVSTFKLLGGCFLYKLIVPSMLQDGESGWSSLHRALHFGHLAVASVLLQSTASIILEDSKFRTPIDLLSGPVLQVIRDGDESGVSWFGI